MTYFSAYDRFVKQKEAYLKGDMETVKKLAVEAKQEMERKGMVKTNLFGWIEKEWLAKALREGVIVQRKDGYVPIVIERVVERVEGHRGRTPLVKKETQLDISRLLEFCKQY